MRVGKGSCRLILTLIFQEEEVVWKLFRMRCPQCEAEYSYEGIEYKYERCPDCYFTGEFREFVMEEFLPPPFYDSEAEYRALREGEEEEGANAVTDMDKGVDKEHRAKPHSEA